MARWSIPLACLLAGALLGAFVAGPALHGQGPVATAIPPEITSYRGVVRMVLPAVVSIETKIKPKVTRRDQGQRRRGAEDETEDPAGPEAFKRFFEEYQRRQDSAPQHGFGSGFLVDPRGVVLTNYHVVEGADQVEVTLSDGRKFTSHDIHGDRKTDLAIVRLQAEGPLPYLALGDSSAMEIGDRVLAVGAPFGLTGSVTAGIVSAKGRNLQVNMYEDFLQTDAAINPGNSGGPLVNLSGQVIGVNSIIKSRTGGFQGVGLAIASDLVRTVMQQLLNGGVVHRGYLGVGVQPLNSDMAQRLGLKPSQTGVAVTQVFDDSPAAKAGIQIGDVITSVGERSIKEVRDLQQMVAGLPLKKPTTLSVVRDGQPRDMPVTILEQPEAYGTVDNAPQRRGPAGGKEPVGLGKAGLEVTDLTTELGQQLGYKAEDAGVLITSVDPDSPAADAGLAQGMLITKVDKQTVKSAAALREQLDKSHLEKGVLLQVKTPRAGTRFVMLKAETAEK